MTVARQLSLLRQPLDRSLLERRPVAVYIVKHLRLHHHKPAVDDLAVLLLLLAKCHHIAVFIELQRALALRKSHRGQRHYPAALPVMLQQLIQIHVRYAVAVAHHKCLITDILPHAPDAPAGHRIQPRVYQRHLPRLRVIVQYLHRVVLQVEAHIAVVQIVVGEIFLYHVLHIPQTYDEIIISVVRIVLHDMPQYRLAPDLDHRLGSEVVAVADAAPEAARQYDYFH